MGKTRVPKEIRDAIRNAAKYNAKAKLYEDIIECWFKQNGVQDDDNFRDTYIDWVQQTNNPEDAIVMFDKLLR